MVKFDIIVDENGYPWVELLAHCDRVSCEAKEIRESKFWIGFPRPGLASRARIAKIDRPGFIHGL